MTSSNTTDSNSEACLQFIYSRFDDYKKCLDDDQRTCDSIIAVIRQRICSYNNNDDRTLQSIAGLTRIELANQLDYFEQEAFKTNEDNKTCLFKMFQNLFNLHHQHDFSGVINSERQIAQSFRYRPSVLLNIERLYRRVQPIEPSLNNHLDKKSMDNSELTVRQEPSTASSLVRSATFCNRADVKAFQQREKRTEPTQPLDNSNEIDLTKFIRETQANNTQFQFSAIADHLKRPKISSIVSNMNSQRPISCNDKLLSGATDRYVLRYNMNVKNLLHLYDIQTGESKQLQWDEDMVLSLGHADSNTFYLITSTKIILYDIIKETIKKQYFLYDTLYKDLLLIMDNSFYKTALKCNNQIQSTVYDDYCYYLYTNKEYNQIFIKCSLDNFFLEKTINLTKLFPNVQYFIDFTVTAKSMITFLIKNTNTYQLYLCNENQFSDIIKNFPLNNLMDPTQIVSTFLPQIKVHPTKANKQKTIKYGKQVWFILDRNRNSIDCVTHDVYITTIEPSNNNNQIQSISINDDKLIFAYDELAVEIIDLNNYFSSFSLY